MTSPFRLGFPRFAEPRMQYDRDNEAQFRRSVEQLLQQVVSATNDTANNLSTVTDTLAFAPDNTIDVGDNATPLRPRTGYFATSVVTNLLRSVTGQVSGNLTVGGTGTFGSTLTAPTVVATTRVTSPLMGTTTATDVVFDRNSVTQLTLGSLLATFAGAATFNGNVLAGTDNSYDLGASGASRFRNGYFAGNLVLGTTPASPPTSFYAQWDNAAGEFSTLGVTWTHQRYGSVTGFTGKYAGGTSGSPTQPAVGDLMLQISATGWTGSAFGSSARAAYIFGAAENWSAGANEGTFGRIDLTGIGKTSRNQRIAIGPGPWSTATTYPGSYVDTLGLFDRDGTAGSGNYGPSLGFGGIASASRRYAALVARQTTADADQIGLSVFIHDSATAGTAMSEIVRFSRSGDLNTGWFGSMLWETDNASDIGASGATRPRAAFHGSASVMGRTLSTDLTLADGDCLIASNYYTIGACTLTLTGDAVLQVI